MPYNFQAFPAWYHSIYQIWISHFWSSFETFNQWLMIGKPIVAGWVFDLDLFSFQIFVKCFNKISVEKRGISCQWAYCLGYCLPVEIECKGLGMLKTLLSCAKDFTTSLTSFYICFYRVYHWFLCWIVKAAIRVASSWHPEGSVFCKERKPHSFFSLLW